MANVGCNGLKGPASKEKFECDGKMVTVQQYFETKLKMKLKFPNLPCVWVGSREKNNLVPMEVNKYFIFIILYLCKKYLKICVAFSINSCVRLRQGKSIDVN